jgi:fucose permease
MAISGGALVPLVMGKLLDLNMGTLSFIVPGVCFAYLLLLSLKSGGKTALPAKPSPTAAQV